VEYPDDHTTPGLAGKKIEYITDVTAVRRKELPEVDDEWAQSLGGEVESVDALKAKIREDLESRSAAESDYHLRGELVRKLLEGHPFEVPESLVEQQTNYRLEGAAREMMGRGIDPRTQNINWESAREELRTQAEEDVRATMLLEKIATAENITVSEEEIDAEIEQIANASRQSKEQVRAALTKNGGERSIAQRLRNRKALDLLIENASVTDAEWIEPKEQG
jgi:trigger factor